MRFRPIRMFWFDWVVSFAPLVIAFLLLFVLKTGKEWAWVVLSISMIAFVIFSVSRKRFVLAGKELFRTRLIFDASSKVRIVPLRFPSSSNPTRMVLIFDDNLSLYAGTVKLILDQDVSVLFDLEPGQKDSFFSGRWWHPTRPKILVATLENELASPTAMELKFELIRIGSNAKPFFVDVVVLGK